MTFDKTIFKCLHTVSTAHIPMTTTSFNLATIPTGFFVLITKDGIVQYHVALFSNTMEPAVLDLSDTFPDASKNGSGEDKSLGVTGENSPEVILELIRKAGRTVRFKGVTDRTSIHQIV